MELDVEKMSDFYLPTDLWLEIFSYLDFKDLVSCSSVNRQIKEASEHVSLWRPLCKKYWLIQVCPKRLSWKKKFSLMYIDMGRYIDCYSKIKKAWDQITDYLEKNCPDIYKSINSGVSEAQLDSAEAFINKTLPTDLRCSYRIHNGQNIICPGIFGSILFNDYYRTDFHLDIDAAVRGLIEKEYSFVALPIISCLNSTRQQSIALTDSGDLIRNHIFTFDALRTSIYIIGTNFTSWFTSYADLLSHSKFTLNKGEIFKFYHEPECVARTGNIKVSAKTCFIPEYSTAGLTNWHSYQITMEMDENAHPSEACQLESRHWIVTDEVNHEERVSGPGVVGEFPIMRPGSTYSWRSATTFKTTYGNMRGHFTMRNLLTGNLTGVQCPTFHMKCPPYMSLPR